MNEDAARQADLLAGKKSQTRLKWVCMSVWKTLPEQYHIRLRALHHFACQTAEQQ